MLKQVMKNSVRLEEEAKEADQESESTRETDKKDSHTIHVFIFTYIPTFSLVDFYGKCR